MTSADPRVLTKEEKAVLQAKASTGYLPSLEEIRNYIHTTRVSFLANQAKGKQPASRLKKKVVDESQVDFF